MLTVFRASRWSRVLRTALGSVILTLLCGFAFATSVSFSSGVKPPASGAQFISPPTLNVHPTARVTQAVDNNKRSTIGGQTPPLIANGQDLGRLASGTQLDHMIMVLQASPEQDYALKTLIDQQLDSGHANFHHWITPAEFGAALGVADADIQQVTNWLSSQGFTVEQIVPGKRFIQFSGSVDAVESAFQTEMHHYSINGQNHISNSADLSVPQALRPVIAGVPTLNDFFKTSNMKNVHTLASSALLSTGKAPQIDQSSVVFNAPDYTSGATHFVGAGDFAVIYNTTPLLSAGNDGAGITIGIIGRTDIALADVQMYREFFQLKNNDPIFVVVGEDPGLVAGDDTESDLDVEVSGGAAPGATVKFITSRATLVTDGVDLSAMYAVQNNLTDIISESYGQCEANFSAAGESFYMNLWAQAAAQGQSVFISTGDDGPAGCDNSNNNFATSGYAVSALASSSYNVAVGGTLFADTTGGPWWGTTATATPPFTSALGYIPETPWNEAKGSGAVGAAGLWSGSGGISAYITTPSWQRGFGVPVTDPPYAGTGAFSSPTVPFVPGPHRYMPDVSMAAAAQHDGTLFCTEGICQLSSTNTIVNAGIVGGTSVAAPTMAGVQALIDQFNGGRQGLPNYVYYALADAQHTAGLNCASNSMTLDPNCAFRDVTTGNTLICANSACTAANKIGWTAAAGYDLATGLGSPNAAKLASLWSTVTFNSTTTTLNLSQSTGINHGQTVTASGAVAPGAGSGVPTGNVSFLVSSGGLGDPVDPTNGGFLNNVPLATLDGTGNYTVDITNLPAGTYTVTARYGGDSTFASSSSLPIQVTVGTEDATATIATNAFNGTTCVETPATTFTYGSYVWTDVTVAGESGQGVPTGTVSITDNGSSLIATSLNANGQGHFLSGSIATTSCVFGYSFQDSPPLTVGTHLLGASYSGDSTFNAATASPVTVTITPATITGALVSGASNIASGDSVVLSFTLNGLSGAGPGTLSPTGTVTFTDTTTAAVLGTATLSPNGFGGVATLTTSAITSSGANAIVASWPGDNNYVAVTSTAATVTVQGGTATSVAVTSNANPSTVGGRPTFTATMTPTTVTSGTVRFYDTVNSTLVSLGTGTVGAAHTATFRPAATVSLTAGVHQIVAVYGGNATFNDSTSPPFAQTFNQTATTLNLTVLGTGTCSQRFSLQADLGLAGTVVPQPSGTVAFMEGGSTIATASFSIVTAAQGGEGLFTAQTQVQVTPGSHTITAVLTDPNYTAPVSNTQVITSSCTVPSITSSFLPPTIAVGGTSTLTFNLTNPNVGPMTGVAFTDTLPSGLAIASPSNLSNSCGGSVVVDATAGSITLSGGSIANSGQCSISVSVIGTALGDFVNTSSVVSADDSGAGNSTSASIAVLGPTLAESFDVSTLPLGASTTLNFTVGNPFTSMPLTGVGFTDTLPAGLVVATPNGLSSGAGDCQSSGGTVTAPAGGNSISLSGASINASDSCTFSVIVTAVQAGVQTNVTGVVTSNEGTGNTATASVTVFVPVALSAVGTATPNSGIVGDSTHLNVTVTAGTNPASTSITVTGDLSSIGGTNPVAFIDNGDGTFGLDATVGASATPGTKSIPVTVTDVQGRTATTNIAFTVLASGTLAGTGVAAPSAVAAGGDTVVLLMVSVTPAINPASTGITVTVDLSSIGGSPTQQFFDDGTHGDQNANDGVYTFATRIPGDVVLGDKTLPVTITDAQSRTANATILLTVNDVIFADGFEGL
jgi:trimeric autotransporter adhesin